MVNLCKNIIQSLIDTQADWDMVWITHKIRAFVIWFGLWITLNLLELKNQNLNLEIFMEIISN